MLSEKIAGIWINVCAFAPAKKDKKIRSKEIFFMSFYNLLDNV
jgi:hypothetical protein